MIESDFKYKMSYYTQKTLKNQLTKYTFHKTNINNCSPLQRCNNYKKCKHCYKIWKSKQFAKATKHLTEKHLKNFKHKYFLTVVSLDTRISVYEKNSNIDLFLKDLISQGRYKTGLFFQSEYFISKQISKSKDLEVNPHLHITFLTNRIFKRDKKLKSLLAKYNLRIDKKDIYKNKDNSYLTSIKKLVNYSLKFNPDTLEIENNYNLTNSKRNIHKSKLFNKRKLAKKQKRLYIYIHQQTALIKAIYKAKLNEAKRILKKFRKNNTTNYIKHLQIYIKKRNLINKAQARKIARVHASAKKVFLTTYTYF